MIKQYRKKPVVIEAIQLTTDNLTFVEDWCRGAIKGKLLPIEQRCIDIQTLEGEMRADIGDYIIKGVEGEFYPVKPQIFFKTYEPV